MTDRLVDRIKRLSNDIAKKGVTIYKSIQEDPDEFIDGFLEYISNQDSSCIDQYDTDAGRQRVVQLATDVITTCTDDVSEILQDIDRFKTDISKTGSVETSDTKNLECSNHSFIYQVYSGDVYGNGGAEDLYLLVEELENKNKKLQNIYATMLQRSSTVVSN